jgi:hypothetical protein
MTWTLPPWCRCFPDHQRSALLEPGLATRSVRMTVPSRLRWVYPAAVARSQGGGQVRGVVGEHGQALVQIAVGGRCRDAVVPGQLDEPGPVDEPPQHEDCLLEGAQRAGASTSPEPFPVFVQQFRDVLGGLPTGIEHRGVGDTGQRVKPLMLGNVIFADLFLPGASLMPDAGSPCRRPAGRHPLQLSGC